MEIKPVIPQQHRCFLGKTGGGTRQAKQWSVPFTAWTAWTWPIRGIRFEHIGHKKLNILKVTEKTQTFSCFIPLPSRDSPLLNYNFYLYHIILLYIYYSYRFKPFSTPKESFFPWEMLFINQLKSPGTEKDKQTTQRISAAFTCMMLMRGMGGWV